MIVDYARFGESPPMVTSRVTKFSIPSEIISSFISPFFYSLFTEMPRSSDDTVGGEDSDIESDFATAAAESGTDYYHPIAADNGSFSESESEPDPDDLDPSDTYLNLSEANGNGISSLDLNNDEEERKEEEEEEEDAVRESEASISRAFREAEQRRSAPLSPEASERIMDLMRGIEFRGAPPVWVDRVSEEQWADQIRRIRRETAAGSSS